MAIYNSKHSFVSCRNYRSLRNELISASRLGLKKETMKRDWFCLSTLHGTSLHCPFWQKNKERKEKKKEKKSNVDKTDHCSTKINTGGGGGGDRAINNFRWYRPRAASGPTHGCLKVDNAIHRRDRYPVDTCWQNRPRYPLDSDISTWSTLWTTWTRLLLFSTYGVEKDCPLHLPGAGKKVK